MLPFLTILTFVRMMFSAVATPVFKRGPRNPNFTMQLLAAAGWHRHGGHGTSPPSPHRRPCGHLVIAGSALGTKAAPMASGWELAGWLAAALLLRWAVSLHGYSGGRKGAWRQVASGCCCAAVPPAAAPATAYGGKPLQFNALVRPWCRHGGATTVWRLRGAASLDGDHCQPAPGSVVRLLELQATLPDAFCAGLSAGHNPCECGRCRSATGCRAVPRLRVCMLC